MQYLSPCIRFSSLNTGPHSPPDSQMIRLHPHSTAVSSMHKRCIFPCMSDGHTERRLLGVTLQGTRVCRQHCDPQQQQQHTEPHVGQTVPHCWGSPSVLSPHRRHGMAPSPEPLLFPDCLVTAALSELTRFQGF